MVVETALDHRKVDQVFWHPSVFEQRDNVRNEELRTLQVTYEMFATFTGEVIHPVFHARIQRDWVVETQVFQLHTLQDDFTVSDHLWVGSAASRSRLGCRLEVSIRRSLPALRRACARRDQRKRCDRSESE